MRRALFASLLPVLATISSCMGATAIDLHITTTSCTALTRADIYVDHPDPTTAAQGCLDSASGEVGHLTIVPSGVIDAKVDITIVGFVGSNNCTPNSTSDTGCIIAKRTLSFNPHHTLPLPIQLDAQCAGFPCGADQTCVVENGAPTCKSVVCDAANGNGISCGGGDGGSADVIAPTDAVVDVGPPACAEIADAGVPTYAWSFNPQGDNQIHEDTNSFAPVPFATGNVLTTKSPTTCGPYLVASSAQQNLVANGYKQLPNFKLALAYRATADGEIIGLSGPIGGFNVLMQSGVVNAYLSTTIQRLAFTDVGKTNDGFWHTFVMTVTSSDAGSSPIATFSVDGAKPVPAAPNTLYAPGTGPLSVGTIDAVDQISIYAQ